MPSMILSTALSISCGAADAAAADWQDNTLADAVPRTPAARDSEGSGSRVANILFVWFTGYLVSALRRRWRPYPGRQTAKGTGAPVGGGPVRRWRVRAGDGGAVGGVDE